MTARKNDGTFATISREILNHPPIAMRKNPARWSLKPIEFAVLCGLTTVARIQLTRQEHHKAFKRGGSEIENEKAHDADYKRRWRQTQKRRQRGEPSKAPYRVHTFDDEPEPIPRVRLKPAIKKAGHEGYRAERDRQRREGPPKFVTFSLTRTAILRFSGLAQNGTNLAAVDAIIHRLSRPIAVNGFYHPPPINNFDEMEDRRISISLNGEYLPARIFARIPLPLPVRSPIGLALFLFLQTIRVGQLQHGSISLNSLCARLGIPTDCRWRVHEQIHRAVDVVNTHLMKLDIPKLRQAGVKLPAKYETREAEDGKVSFIEVPYRRGMEFDGVESPVEEPKRARADDFMDDIGEVETIVGFGVSRDDMREQIEREEDQRKKHRATYDWLEKQSKEVQDAWLDKIDAAGKF